MPNINDVFPSKTLRAEDLEGQEHTLTISHVTIETLGQGRDAQDKPVVYFTNEDRGFVLNKTNASVIAEMYGPETDDWTGKQITIFPTQVDFQGKVVDAIRVRKRAKPSARPMGSGNRPAPNRPPVNPDADDLTF